MLILQFSNTKQCSLKLRETIEIDYYLIVKVISSLVIPLKKLIDFGHAHSAQCLLHYRMFRRFYPVPCYLNSGKLFLTLSDWYFNPERGFKPGSVQDGCFWRLPSYFANHSATTAGCTLTLKLLKIFIASHHLLRKIIDHFQWERNSILKMFYWN